MTSRRRDLEFWIPLETKCRFLTHVLRLALCFRVVTKLSMLLLFRSCVVSGVGGIGERRSELVAWNECCAKVANSRRENWIGATDSGDGESVVGAIRQYQSRFPAWSGYCARVEVSK